MKLTLSLTTLCLTFSIAHADLVVEQKVESPFMNGTVTMKVKGNLVRVDAPTPQGQMVSLFDLDKGKMTVLMAAQKTAMEMDLAAMKAQAAAVLKGGAGAEEAKPKATGAKKKIGEWDAEEYTMTTQGMAMHFWTAPNYPNGKQISEELAKVSKGMSAGMPDPNAFGLPGVVVQSEVDTQVGKVTTTLQSAKQGPVEASEFAVPEGYNVVKPPAGLGGGK